MPGRIITDKADIQALRQKLTSSIDPLHQQHPDEGLVNVVTGRVINHPKINVDSAIELASVQMKTFEMGWPDSFHSPIPRKVNTLELSKKHLKVGETKVFDTETIYTRAMGLQ